MAFLGGTDPDEDLVAGPAITQDHVGRARRDGVLQEEDVAAAHGERVGGVGVPVADVDVVAGLAVPDHGRDGAELVGEAVAVAGRVLESLPRGPDSSGTPVPDRGGGGRAAAR